jgi:hypothetical protein
LTLADVAVKCAPEVAALHDPISAGALRDHVARLEVGAGERDNPEALGVLGANERDAERDVSFSRGSCPRGSRPVFSSS